MVFNHCQVTGELSNAGQPMRRFTQTFVLAAQAPKTYYVHNDIFRYQDLGFPDDEEAELEGAESGLGDSAERDADECRGSEPEEDEQPAQVQQHGATTTVADQHAPLIPTQQQPLQQQQQQPLYYAAGPQQAVHPMIQPVINGSVHEETPLINQQPALQPQQNQYIKNEAVESEQFNQEPENDATDDQQQQGEDEPQGPTVDSSEPADSDANFSTSSGREPEVEPTSVANSSKPKTFANLFAPSFSTPLPQPAAQPPKASVSPVRVSYNILFTFTDGFVAT